MQCLPYVPSFTCETKLKKTLTEEAQLTVLMAAIDNHHHCRRRRGRIMCSVI
jgi:hypothetical protein